MDNIQVISIEGNIGSGKSSTLQYIKQWATNMKNLNILFVDEPTAEWDDIKDNDGETILSKFYSNQDKYAFPFQMMAFITRYRSLKKAMDDAHHLYDATKRQVTVITERCLYTDKFVFAQMLYDTHKMEEVNYQIYRNWFDMFADHIPVNKVLYINTPPEVCMTRILQRDRAGENTIELPYISSCDMYHTNMINYFKNQDKKLCTMNGVDNIHSDEVWARWLITISQFIAS